MADVLLVANSSVAYFLELVALVLARTKPEMGSEEYYRHMGCV